MFTYNEWNDTDSDGKKGYHRKWVVLLLVLLVLAAFYAVIPYGNLQEAEKLQAEERYEDATALYSKYRSHLIWKGKATEGYISSKTGIAEKAVVECDYDQAIEVYRELGNSEKMKEVQEKAAAYHYGKGAYQKAATLYEEVNQTLPARVAWSKYGDTLMESYEFEQAIEAYTNAKNENKLQSAQLSWAERLAEDHQFEEAAEHYILGGRGDKAREIMIAKAEQMIADGDTEGIIKALEPYKGIDVAELLFQAQKVGIDDIQSEDAVNSARRYGDSMTDLEMLLYYCRRLYENQYDLKKIFPEGIAIEMDLAQYQIYNFESDDDSTDPDYSGIIVFSREDAVPDLERKFTFYSNEASSAVDDKMKEKLNGGYDYSVKLRPELMIDLFSENQAWSLDDCTAYVILDEGFLPYGAISIRTTSASSGSKNSSTLSSWQSGYYEIFYYYLAYSAITVYDRNHSQRFKNYDTYMDPPIAANAVVGNSYSDSGIDLTGLQVEEIQKALEDRNSEESKSVLEKYDSQVIEFVEQNGWGDYILMPDRDENGNQKNIKGTSRNISSWNISKYMVGQRDETWITRELDDGAMASLALYFLFSGT